MEFFKEVLVEILSKENINVSFPNIKIDISKLVEMKSFDALQEIKNIIHDESLSDIECFMKIEKIICVLEDIGSGGGFRHDF